MEASALTQRRIALKSANEIRSAQARLKRTVAQQSTREGMHHVAHVVNNPPPMCEGLKVRKLLASITAWGDTKVSRAMKSAGLSAYTALGDLTERQQDVLATYLRTKA